MLALEGRGGHPHTKNLAPFLCGAEITGAVPADMPAPHILRELFRLWHDEAELNQPVMLELHRRPIAASAIGTKELQLDLTWREDAALQLPGGSRLHGDVRAEGSRSVLAMSSSRSNG